MGKKLHVGNLDHEVLDSDLTKLFEPHGRVESAQVVMDRDTGRSKGFGIVEMGSDEEAQAAIAALNGRNSGGRALTVSEARARPRATAMDRGRVSNGNGWSRSDYNGRAY